MLTPFSHFQEVRQARFPPSRLSHGIHRTISSLLQNTPRITINTQRIMSSIPDYASIPWNPTLYTEIEEDDVRTHQSHPIIQVSTPISLNPP